MKIKNISSLAKTKTRKVALEIVEVGLAAIDTELVIKKHIRLEHGVLYVGNDHFVLSEIGRLLVVGVGKCAFEAGQAIEPILGKYLTDGVVVDVHGGALKKIKAYQGTHPFPTEANVDATKAIINLLTGLTEKDLVIFLISGGGSTLLCQPNNFTCVQEKELVECLFSAGADIEELNTIRKHLSLARGGYLAKYAYPAAAVSLIFSDVPGDNLEFISSGPTVKDTTTINDAIAIAKKYKIESRCGFPLTGLLETPKEDQYFEKVKNILIVSNGTALDAMAKKAVELGFSPHIVTRKLVGEARKVGYRLIQDLNKAASKSVLLYGGETTVIVKKPGRGGRNQEVGLSALRFLKPGQSVAIVASDGRDNTDFAGVICDMMTKEKAEALGLQLDIFLEENKSYEFFSEVGDYLLNGDTGSNVSDLFVAIYE